MCHNFYPDSRKSTQPVKKREQTHSVTLPRYLMTVLETDGIERTPQSNQARHIKLTQLTRTVNSIYQATHCFAKIERKVEEASWLLYLL